MIYKQRLILRQPPPINYEF